MHICMHAWMGLCSAKSHFTSAVPSPRSEAPQHPRQVDLGAASVVAPDPGQLDVAEALVAQVDVQITSLYVEGSEELKT